MLSDRDYMNHRRGGFGNRPGDPDGPGISPIPLIIITNIIVFILQSIQPNATGDLALSSPGLTDGKYWQLITHMFAHAGLGHIFFNMYVLFIFGSIMYSQMGNNKFLLLYFISGLTGAGLWLAFSWGSPIPILGASGCVMGVVLATAMFYPDLQILFFFIVPMRLRALAILLIIVDSLGSFSARSGIAHLAHLGGCLGAYVFIKIAMRDQIRWDPLFFFSRKHRNPLFTKNLKTKKEGWHFEKTGVSQKDLDRILDKISYEGINSLTDEEMDVLRRAREDMQGTQDKDRYRF